MRARNFAQSEQIAAENQAADFLPSTLMILSRNARCFTLTPEIP